MLRFFRDRMLDRLVTASPLFSRFAPDDARKLIARFKFLEIEPKTRVVRQGERASGLFLLLVGEAAVSRGAEQVARLQPGSLFGEMSMLSLDPATASVDTLTKCWALRLAREDFQEIMLTYPQLLEFVIELVDQRRAKGLPSEGGVPVL
jgi:CRP-like cAMP-binding protein